MSVTLESLSREFGQIDIYLFDQLLRGRVAPDHRVLDAGCGRGRNSRFLMRAGVDIYGIDRDADSIAHMQRMATEVAPHLPESRFRVGVLEDLPFGERRFDVVICSAVLHFAEDEANFERMMAEMWRVLKPGGLFFSRLASSIGIEDEVRPVEGRVHDLPDGTRRFLVDEPYLSRLETDLNAEAVDPLKTTNVQNLRAMTTWVLRKRS